MTLPVGIHEGVPAAEYHAIRMNVYSTRDEWLAARRLGIGSSDVPIILGLLADVSPYRLWLEKTEGGNVRPDPTYWMERGKALEGFLAERFERETGRGVIDPGEFAVAQHPRQQWMLATVDRLSFDPLREIDDHFQPLPSAVLELKAPTGYGLAEYGEHPSRYTLTQVQWQLLVTGYNLAHVAVDFGTRLGVYEVHAHRKLQEALYGRAAAFWRCVIDRMHPPMDGHPDTSRALGEALPEDVDLEIVLNQEQTAVGTAALAADAQHTTASAEREAYRNRLRSLLGEATAAVAYDGSYRVTYKSNSKGVRNLRIIPTEGVERP